MNMESANSETVVGRRCRLLKPVRDHEGLSRFSEKASHSAYRRQPRAAYAAGAVRRRCDHFLVSGRSGRRVDALPDRQAARVIRGQSRVLLNLGMGREPNASEFLSPDHVNLQSVQGYRLRHDVPGYPANLGYYA